jgi:hypothetical protein
VYPNTKPYFYGNVPLNDGTDKSNNYTEVIMFGLMKSYPERGKLFARHSIDNYNGLKEKVTKFQRELTVYLSDVPHDDDGRYKLDEFDNVDIFDSNVDYNDFKSYLEDFQANNYFYLGKTRFAKLLQNFKSYEDKCSYCFQGKGVVECSRGCTEKNYCSKECQRLDYSFHKKECFF